MVCQTNNVPHVHALRKWQQRSLQQRNLKADYRRPWHQLDNADPRPGDLQRRSTGDLRSRKMASHMAGEELHADSQATGSDCGCGILASSPGSKACMAAQAASSDVRHFSLPAVRRMADKTEMSLREFPEMCGTLWSTRQRWRPTIRSRWCRKGKE